MVGGAPSLNPIKNYSRLHGKTFSEVDEAHLIVGSRGQSVARNIPGGADAGGCNELVEHCHLVTRRVHEHVGGSRSGTVQ